MMHAIGTMTLGPAGMAKTPSLTVAVRNMRIRAQELMMNMITAGTKVTIHAFLFFAVLSSQMVMPTNARAASSWFEAPSVVQKTFHARTGLPSESFNVMRINAIGAPMVITVERMRPNQPFQPLSS